MAQAPVRMLHSSAGGSRSQSQATSQNRSLRTGRRIGNNGTFREIDDALKHMLPRMDLNSQSPIARALCCPVGQMSYGHRPISRMEPSETSRHGLTPPGGRRYRYPELGLARIGNRVGFGAC